MECKNCGTVVTEIYCPKCGQHSRVGKLNFSNFVQEVSETIFQVDRGFFKTVMDLFWRPGYAIRDYLQGKRKEYYRPLSYALALSTLYFVLTRLLDLETFLGQAISGFNAGYDDSVKGDFKFDVNLIIDNYAIISLLLIPFYAFSMFIAFKGKGYNYLEHIAIRSFVVGQQAIIYLLFSLLTYLFGKNDILESIGAFSAIGYVFWVNIQLFKPNPKWKTIMKTIGFYLLFALIVNIILFGLTLILFLFGKIF